MVKENLTLKREQGFERIMCIPLTELHPFPAHPYGIREDQANPAHFRSDDEAGNTDSISGDTARNNISLDNLLPELMQMVDNENISDTCLSDRGAYCAVEASPAGNHRQRSAER